MVDQREDLGNAIALNASLFNAARLIGPSIAGIVVAAVGEGVCFLINSLSFCGVLASLVAMRLTPQRLKIVNRHVLHELREGITYSFDDDGTRFYVLGLAPNAARISVRFWHVATVGELAANIRQHFNDLAIVHESYEKPYLPLRRLLNSTAPATSKHPFGDPDRIAPNLAGDLMKSILAGTPYPQTLLQAALRRIRAEQARKDKTGKPLANVTYERAGLIKAFLNRQIRYSNLHNEQVLNMSLDENNTNIGYRLGRLFAALEIIQQDAGGGQKKINSTIRDRYYGAASSTPLAVFPTLLRLSQHHQTSLRKEKPGLFVERDKLLGRIMDDGINGQIGFPPVLSLENQGRFAIGYYQQRQAFFPNKHSLAT